MTVDLEDRIREALAARAETTTVSPDARAAVAARVVRRDHRRAVVLRGAAAAVVAVLLVGGIAVLASHRNDGNVTATATSGSAKRSSGAEAAPAGPVPRYRVERGAGGSVTVRVGGVGLVVEPATIQPIPEPIPAARSGNTVFGVAPAVVGAFTVSPPGGRVEQFEDPALPGSRVFVVDEAPAGPVRIEARDASGRLVAVVTMPAAR